MSDFFEDFCLYYFFNYLQDDFADNREFITLLVYKNNGQKVYYPCKIFLYQQLTSMMLLIFPVLGNCETTAMIMENIRQLVT